MTCKEEFARKSKCPLFITYYAINVAIMATQFFKSFSKHYACTCIYWYNNYRKKSPEITF